MIWIRHCRLLC